jgi:hypothetical protein
MDPTSFISEHTAEYALVRSLVGILSRQFSTIIPVYFWAAREGSSIAARGMGQQHVRVITAYARRPKVVNPEDSIVLMKINALLLQAGAAGLKVGIPLFAGVPLAAGLLQFSIETPCSWFHINGRVPGDQDVEIRISLSGEVQESNSSRPGVVGPLTADDLLSIVQSEARVMPWEVAVNCIRRVRSSGEIGMRAFFFSGYRPFYLVVPAEN